MNVILGNDVTFQAEVSHEIELRSRHLLFNVEQRSLVEVLTQMAPTHLKYKFRVRTEDYFVPISNRRLFGDLSNQFQIN